MNPGIYPAIPRAEYEAIDACNYSLLKHFDISAAHAREYMLHPPEPSQAMEFGTALHACILEPEEFTKNYVAAPKFDRRTTAGKAAWAEFEKDHPGRSYLSAEESEACTEIMKAIDKSETASLLLRGQGKNEVTIVWVDEETKLLCKGRIDRFTSLYGWSVVVDVKSTQSAFTDLFSLQSTRMKYHVQAAFYVDGLKAIAPADRRFITFAIEKSRPYCFSAFEYDEQAIAEGRARYRSYLKMYAECKKTGNWPGYPDGITPLTLPRWAVKEVQYDNL